MEKQALATLSNLSQSYTNILKAIENMYGGKCEVLEEYRAVVKDIDVAVKAIEDGERYKLALYSVIRNTNVLPAGLQMGKSMEEIDYMTLKTMETILGYVDYDRVREWYEQGKNEKRLKEPI